MPNTVLYLIHFNLFVSGSRTLLPCIKQVCHIVLCWACWSGATSFDICSQTDNMVPTVRGSQGKSENVKVPGSKS